MHRHQLQCGLPDLKPLTGFEHELGQTLSVVPSAVRTADVSDPNLVSLEMDLGVPTRGLWIVENDVARLAADCRDRCADVARLGRSIDVLDLEDVVAAHSRLRRGGGASLATHGCVRKHDPYNAGTWGKPPDARDPHGAQTRPSLDGSFDTTPITGSWRTNGKRARTACPTRHHRGATAPGARAASPCAPSHLADRVGRSGSLRHDGAARERRVE
jgi:hypothetical protein